MLSQISSFISRIETKRKQLSASEYPAAKNENIDPRGKNDIMRSSEKSHSHPFENEEFRQLCETKRKKRRIIVIAKNDNAESRLQKVRYMNLRKTKECCFSYRALQPCKALDNVAYKACTSSLNSVWTCRRNKGILMIRALSRFLFVLFLFLLLLVFSVVLQSC